MADTTITVKFTVREFDLVRECLAEVQHTCNDKVNAREGMIKSEHIGHKERAEYRAKEARIIELQRTLGKK